MLSLLMILQASTKVLPLTSYILVITSFATLIVLSILISTESVILFGILLFFLTRGLTYFVATNFLVLSFADSYGQFGLLQSITQTHHATIISGASFLSPLVNPSGYSNWPGMQVLSSMLQQLTGASVFNVALVLPIVLYPLWLIVSFLLIRNLVTQMFSLRRIEFWAITVVGSLSSTWLLSYKYDILSVILISASLLLLAKLVKGTIGNNRASFAIFLCLFAAASVTQGYSALTWLLFVTGIAVLSQLAKMTSPTTGIERALFKSVSNNLRFIVLSMTTIMVVWWTYFALFAWQYIGGFNNIFSTLTDFTTRVTPLTTSNLTSLMPNLILDILRVRNLAVFGLFGIGILVLMVGWNRFKPKGVLLLLLLGSLFVTIGMLLPAAGLEGRNAEILAPLLGVIILVPAAVVMQLNKYAGKFVVVTICWIFLFAGAIGYWGTSYAPIHLYDKAVSSESLGEHPLSYPAVANFFQNQLNVKCIFSNELYVTALSVPYSDWQKLQPIGSTPVGPNCLVVVFDQLNTFNGSYIVQPFTPYKNFSYTALHYQLQTTDMILTTSLDVEVYFVPMQA